MIKINRLFRDDMTPLELYDATRRSWVLGERRNKAQYAAAVYKNTVKEVYRIEEWYPCEDRWAFKGTSAEESIRDSFLNKSVKEYFPIGAANPIKYLNI